MSNSDWKLTKRGENVRDFGLMVGTMLVLAFILMVLALFGGDLGMAFMSHLRR